MDKIKFSFRTGSVDLKEVCQKWEEELFSKLISNKEVSDYLNMFLNTNIDFKIASNILLGEISFYLNKNNE